MSDDKPEATVDPRDLWFAEWQLVLPKDAREAWPGQQHAPGVKACEKCGDSGVVPDGEIPSAFGNAPIKCVKDCPACKGVRGVALPAADLRAPAILPESMSRDDMLRYYSEYSNMVANEVVNYQRRIRELEAALTARGVGVLDEAQRNVHTALRMLIADDGYAMTFQTMGQYRTALLRAIDAAADAAGVAEVHGETFCGKSPMEESKP